MPLSPLRARLALVAFVAIATAVGGNLVAMQGPRIPPADGTQRAERVRPMSDAERLNRLALEASSGGAATQPSPASVAASEPKRQRTGEPARAIQRVGSFAPSSSALLPSALPGADPAEARRATVKAVQGELAKRGYEPGAANGVVSLVTRGAVMAYEHDQGLPLTADPSPEVLAHLRHGTSAPGAAIGLEANAPLLTRFAEDVIRSVQQSLGQLGYLSTSADGVATEETVRAIREFEMDTGLVPTGRVSGPLVARLARANGRTRTETP